MSEDVFTEARRRFERLPGPGLLQQSMTILAREGVPMPAIRRWGVSIAREYGTWDYCRADFPRLLGAAVHEAIAARQLQPHKGV